MKISVRRDPRKNFAIFTLGTISITGLHLALEENIFTEKKYNYFSDKVQEKKVSKWDFQDGKKTISPKKKPQTTSQLLWLAPISTTKIFPPKVEKSISS